MPKDNNAVKTTQTITLPCGHRFVLTEKHFRQKVLTCLSCGSLYELPKTKDRLGISATYGWDEDFRRTAKRRVDPFG